MKKIKVYSSVFFSLAIFFLYGVSLYPHSAFLPTGKSLEGPSINHLLGTDNLGIDIYAQISNGFFRSMFIGIITALFATVIGTLLGVLAGYIEGVADNIITFLINVFLSIPQLPIMIVIGVFLGQSTWNVIIIIAAFSWAQIAKQIRAKTISIKNMQYVALAKSYGGKPLYIISKHLIREIIPMIIVNGIGVVGRAIVQESSLAFLGLSNPLAKSWGLMISKAISFQGIYFTEYWKWWVVSPVMALVLSIVCLRLFSRSVEQYILRRG